eukprot:COSAG03_NODE_581_length_6869_cov_71.096750_2_plen_118_part_00
MRTVVPFEVGADFIIVQRLEARGEGSALAFRLQARFPLPSSAAPARAGGWSLRAAATGQSTGAPIAQVDETLQPAHEHRELRGRKEESREVGLRDRPVQRAQQRDDVEGRERSLGSG